MYDLLIIIIKSISLKSRYVLNKNDMNSHFFLFFFSSTSECYDSHKV